MNRDLSDYRLNYDKAYLLEENCPSSPFDLFLDWFEAADKADSVIEANAMNLSTIGEDGFPKNRIVLLKRFSKEGFVFYTNYNSEKGLALKSNPNVCLSFFWESLQRQIIIKGIVEKVSDELSDSYFSSRPKDSQLGACASDQSSVLGSRFELEDKLEKLTVEYKDKDISRPSHWGGYIVKPVSVEFWQGRPSRLHDRIRYSNKGSWLIERLAP